MYIYQLECQADKLVDIEVQCEDATRQAIKWLPDSGAEVDAMSEQDFTSLTSKPKVLLPERETVLVANSERLHLGVFVEG